MAWPDNAIKQPCSFASRDGFDGHYSSYTSKCLPLHVESTRESMMLPNPVSIGQLYLVVLDPACDEFQYPVPKEAIHESYDSDHGRSSRQRTLRRRRAGGFYFVPPGEIHEDSLRRESMQCLGISKLIIFSPRDAVTRSENPGQPNTIRVYIVSVCRGLSLAYTSATGDPASHAILKRIK